MTVLLSDGEGRRCDATCYNAKHPDCDCICGGLCHGKGLEDAAELLKGDSQAEPLVRAYYRANGREHYFGIINWAESYKAHEAFCRQWFKAKAFRYELIAESEGE